MPDRLVDDEENDVGLEDREFGLPAHPAGQRVLRRVVEPGRVDQREIEVAEFEPLLPAASRGHARLVVDESQLATDEAAVMNKVDLPTLGRPMMATLLMA